MARDFNGSTDRIDYPSAFDTTGQAITIAMWAWFDESAPATNKYLFNSAISGGGAGTIFQQVGSSTTVLSFVRVGSTLLQLVSDGNDFSTGTWHHVIVTHNGTMTSAADAHIYVDNGELGYSSTINGATETTANSGFQLGARASDDLRNHNGRIAEAGVWNRVISAGERAALAKGFPPSDFPYLLKFYDPLIRSTGNRRGGAATLDGTTVIQHPRIIRRVAPWWRPNVAGAAPAGGTGHRIIGGGWGGRTIGA